MKKIISIFVVAFILAGLAIYQYADKDPKSISSAAPSDEFKPKAGYEAAEFQLQGLDEQTYAVGGKENKLIFVNFWASWCGPCELEAPDLQKLHENYSDVMTIYGVNATHYDKERTARQFVEDFEFTFPILMDREGGVTSQYKVNTFPTNFLIDKDGIIRERINGVITYEEWERLIQKWL